MFDPLSAQVSAQFISGIFVRIPTISDKGLPVVASDKIVMEMSINNINKGSALVYHCQNSDVIR